MKIIDGLKLKGRPAEIPDCSREDLPKFFKEMGYKVGAEIGVFKGNFTKLLCKAGLRMYGIDPWASMDDYSPGDSGFQEREDYIFNKATNNLASYHDCTIIRKTSMEALKDFEDESLDFVYIDGNHNFKHVAQDLFEWSKKVRKGGALAGHDYFYSPVFDHWCVCQVAYVVDAYTRAFRIDQWYLLGRKSALPGEKRDPHRSWMWIKK